MASKKIILLTPNLLIIIMLKNIFFVALFFISLTSYAQDWNEYYNKGKQALEYKQYKKGFDYLTKARFEVEKEFGTNHENYIKVIETLAESYDKGHHYENAISLYLTISKYYKEKQETNTLRYGQLHIIIGSLYQKQVRYKSAANYMKAGINIIQTVKGQRSKEYIHAYVGYINLYLLNGLNAKAEEHINKVLPIAMDILGTKHETYIDLLHKQSKVYQEGKNYKLEIESLTKYINACKSIKKPINEYNRAYLDLALAYQVLKNKNKLAENYKIYLANQKMIHGETNSTYLEDLDNAIFIFDSNGLKEASIIFIKDRLKIEYTSTSKKKYNRIISLLITLAEQQEYINQYDLALSNIKKAEKIADDQTEVSDIQYIASRDALASYYIRKGNVEKSIESLKTTLKVIEKRYDNNHLSYGEYLLKISNYYLDNQQIDSSKYYAKKTKVLYEEQHKKSHYIYGNALTILGKIAILNKDFELAKKIIAHVSTNYLSYYGSRSNQYVSAIEWLADIELKLDNRSMATQLYTQALTICSRLEGTSGKQYKRISEKMKALKQ